MIMNKAWYKYSIAFRISVVLLFMRDTLMRDEEVNKIGLISPLNYYLPISQ